MTSIEIERALNAFKWTCPHSSILTKLDGTKEVFECFARDAKEKRKFRCDGKCKRAKKFLSMLKEPKQY